MRKIPIIILLLATVSTHAKNLPKRLPTLKAKQEKIVKKTRNKHTIVILRKTSQKKNRGIASSDAIVVSDPMFSIKPQK